MNKIVFLLLFILGFSCARKLTPEQEFNRSLFKAADFTAMNIFSRNIEGPAFDKTGKLYVVNYEKDGTIGLVHPDGKAELFVTLPGKSIPTSM